jgi:hypothetical protein
MDLRKLEHIGEGVECRCFALSEKRVVKVYRTKEARDRAWKRQKRAYRARIGPRTFGRLRINCRRWAYISARGKETGNAPTERLIKKAEKLGFSSGDLYGRNDNHGMWRGREVIFDFGDKTLELIV